MFRHVALAVASRRRLSLDYLLGELFLGRAVPASFFTILVIAKLWTLPALLQTSAGAWDLHAAAVLIQRVATILFTSLVVALFVVRRPIVGRRSGFGPAIVALMGTFAMWVPAAAPVTNPDTLSMLLSTALTLAGMFISIISLTVLGRCFGIFPEARGLVTRGPYGLVRHPLYVGEIVATLGQVMIAASPALLALFAVFVSLQAWRAAYEEKALREVFPEYADYLARTAKFVPRVY